MKEDIKTIEYIKIKDDLENPLISIIICAFSSKRFDMTVYCINSVFNNTYKNYEIILIIDGNDELKRKMDEKFKEIENMIIIGNEKNMGPSISRNNGVKLSKGDIVAFIDDDAFITPEWLECIVKNFREYSDILVVGGKLLLVYENGAKELPEEILWIVGGTYKGHPEHKQLVRNVFTGNMAVREAVFDYINFEVPYESNNGFLSPIKQLEDTLFCVRINDKKPNSVLYDPDLIAYHNVPKERLTLKYIFNRTFTEGILKAKIGNMTTNKVLSHEYGYLNMVLISIIKNFCTFNIRKALLLSFTTTCVGMGYLYCTLQEKYSNIKNILYQKYNGA